MPQRPLFDSESTDNAIDEIVRGTRRTPDEYQWERERSRKSRDRQVVEQPLPTGPCCARCQRWSPIDPRKRDVGDCGVLVVITVAIPAGYNRSPIQKGEIFPIAEARARRLAAYESLRTRPGFTCADGHLCPVDGYLARLFSLERAA